MTRYTRFSSIDTFPFNWPIAPEKYGALTRLFDIRPKDQYKTGTNTALAAEVRRFVSDGRLRSELEERAFETISRKDVRAILRHALS